MAQEKQSTYMVGKDMFLLPDGSTYHLGVKAGDLFPRILTVGEKSRAQLIATLFDSDKPVKAISSKREFHIFSGYYKGVGVSIIAIGMGTPMMDFMMREATFVQPGPMAVIRLGTCGIFNKNLIPGTVLTAGKGSMYAYVNYAHFSGCANDEKIGKDSPPYLMCNPVLPDKQLNSMLFKSLTEARITSHDGLCLSGETFYSCQGRKDPHFNDLNDDLVDTFRSHGVDFVEMEIHQLFYLAKIRHDPCYVAAAAIGIVQRTNESLKANITTETLHDVVTKAAVCCLQTLVDFKL